MSYSDKYEGSDNSPRRERYRCNREERCKRCDERYRTRSSYSVERSRSIESKERVNSSGMYESDVHVLDSGVFLNEELLRNSAKLGANYYC